MKVIELLDEHDEVLGYWGLSDGTSPADDASKIDYAVLCQIAKKALQVIACGHVARLREADYARVEPDPVEPRDRGLPLPSDASGDPPRD